MRAKMLTIEFDQELIDLIETLRVMLQQGKTPATKSEVVRRAVEVFYELACHADLDSGMSIYVTRDGKMRTVGTVRRKVRTARMAP